MESEMGMDCRTASERCDLGGMAECDLLGAGTSQIGTRAAIVALLERTPMTRGQIVQALGKSPTAVQWHLDRIPGIKRWGFDMSKRHCGQYPIVWRLQTN